MTWAWRIMMRRVLKYCDDKGMEHFDDKGMEHCDDKWNGAL